MLTVITGPPCAGKSTVIAENATPGDVIIDLDRIALALSVDGTPHHSYPDYVRWVAVAARKGAIAEAIRWHHKGFTVWLIDTDPTWTRRTNYRNHGATFIDLDPGLDTVLARAEGQRPPEIIEYIHRYYQTHLPAGNLACYAHSDGTHTQSDGITAPGPVGGAHS